MPDWSPESGYLNLTSIYSLGLQQGWQAYSQSSNVSIQEQPHAGIDNMTAMCFSLPTPEVSTPPNRCLSLVSTLIWRHAIVLQSTDAPPKHPHTGSLQ